MLTFQVERFSAIREEAEPIFERHWREIAVDQERIAYAPDWSKYDAMEKSGLLHTITVRHVERSTDEGHGDQKVQGKLVGYFIALILHHPHYSTAGRMAMTDVYYILPEFRRGGSGAKMLAAVEHSLKALQVSKAYLSTKIHDDHSELFERMGWRLTDKCFTKLL